VFYDLYEADKERYQKEFIEYEKNKDTEAKKVPTPSESSEVS